MSREKGMEVLMSRGWLAQDVDEIYIGDAPERMPKRIYFVQLDGGLTTKAKWSEPTTVSPQRYLREIADKYPDAMILRTKYL